MALKVYFLKAQFWAYALERAVKTTAQTLAAFVAVEGLSFAKINWPEVLSVSLLAGLSSILTSLATDPTNSKQAPDSPPPKLSS